MQTTACLGPDLYPQACTRTDLTCPLQAPRKNTNKQCCPPTLWWTHSKNARRWTCMLRWPPTSSPAYPADALSPLLRALLPSSKCNPDVLWTNLPPPHSYFQPPRPEERLLNVFFAPLPSSSAAAQRHWQETAVAAVRRWECCIRRQSEKTHIDSQTCGVRACRGITFRINFQITPAQLFKTNLKFSWWFWYVGYRWANLHASIRTFGHEGTLKSWEAA